MAHTPIAVSYPDIRHESHTVKVPDYPARCPQCNAGRSPWSEHVDQWQGPRYKCGGQFKSKSQIQNHTDVWSGYCPVRREQDRVANGVACKECGGLNVLTTPFDWDCMFCDTENPHPER